MTEAVMYTQEQLDIALLKQESSTTSVALSRIENELISIDSKIESKIEKIDSKIESNFKWQLSFMISGFVGVLGLMAHGFKWF